MMGIYCKYCNHHWKVQRDYDKHLNCCEYFYHLRRNPQPEMDEHGVKIPSAREMFRYMQELSLRLERTEKEVVKLKAQLNTRQKKAIIEWLNQPSQIPANTFEDWYKACEVNESHVLCVGERDLTVGMQMSINEFLGANSCRPIRTFTQKPNMFYVYSRDGGTEAVLPEPRWRIMSNEQMDGMLLHISQLFVREFLKWQKKQSQEEKSERESEKEILFMMKINGARTPAEKRVQEIKKWMFPKLEENLRVIMECEFE